MLLEATGLIKKYNGKTVVDNISFSLNEGEAYGLLGPNGAGKSTTIGMIFGLVRPDGGTVMVEGLDAWQKPLQAKKLLGYVPQEIALYGDLSARENLMFWGRMYDLGGSRLKDRVAQVLDIVGLSERGGDKVETFSGGMKRRINIAAALLHEPKVLIMDEPTVGIDPQSRTYILETVKNLNAQGTTVIYTSHYMEEVEFLCHRIGVIDHGRLIAQGTLHELRSLVGEAGQVSFVLRGSRDGFLEAVQSLPQVKQATLQEDRLVVTTTESANALAAVAATLAAAGVEMQKVDIQEPNLEAVFLHLTGRALRD
ncbi:ABC transporter related protein [Dethiobacter alkaliphilus AHT 1]|uniref:ABC transporter related protein n=1 Tax=Dethiobacter alkaliphilus AHT 1 TaxID=555088 RepID=C0GCV6_DETAL|nr:ABC transporter related protein [Dethiobacter alkaliphilus AHT 1]